MAIWQFWVDFIPRKHLIDRFGLIPKMADSDLISELGEGISLPGNYDEILCPLGSGEPLEWLTNTRNWGDYDNGSHITIRDLDSVKTSVWSRLHVGEWDHDFASLVLSFAELCDCVLLTKNETVIDPIMDDLIEEVKRSNSYRFCVSPKEYLVSNEVARLNENVKKKLNDV
jgi:hypothetical protein